MKCHKCKRTISKEGYKWLGKIWCCRCFDAERTAQLGNRDIDWNYETVRPHRGTYDRWLK